MLSQLTEAMIVNGVVLATVLASDLGPPRKIGRMRLLRPVSSAGWPYALFWAVVIGARAVLSYGAAHWFTASIVAWCIASRVSEAAITDGLIFMAITMIVVQIGRAHV